MTLSAERDEIIDDLLHLAWSGIYDDAGAEDPRRGLIVIGLVMAVAVVEHGLDREAGAIEVDVLVKQGKRTMEARFG